jgi:1-acyl-sn-glycerol-3-phosphate acyltransferase
LLYRLLKIPARIAFYLYCRKLRINNKDILKKKGPLLIAANHPNAFLDAIVLTTLFREPVYSLTRGDAFSNKYYRKLLHSLKMLPIYRLKEGPGNIERNYSTFDSCIDIFSKGGIVLIFSEGESINDWRLRSLKKGTARLSLTAWQKGIPLEVLPVGINYSWFRSFGKDIILNFGDIITEKDISNKVEGGAISEFNSLLNSRLEQLVYPREKMTSRSVSLLKKILLFIPSKVGYLLHYPLYLLVNLLIRKRDNDMYDSMLVGLLFVTYPFYLLLIYILLTIFLNWTFGIILVLLVPLMGWSYLQLKSLKGPEKRTFSNIFLP